MFQSVHSRPNRRRRLVGQWAYLGTFPRINPSSSDHAKEKRSANLHLLTIPLQLTTGNPHEVNHLGIGFAGRDCLAWRLVPRAVAQGFSPQHRSLDAMGWRNKSVSPRTPCGVLFKSSRPCRVFLRPKQSQTIEVVSPPLYIRWKE